MERKKKGREENDRGKKVNEGRKGRGGREKSKHFLRVQIDFFW